MATTASHVWRPSASRVLIVDGFIPGPRGTPIRSPVALQWPAKDPADTLDYQFDIAPALAGNDGDSLSTIDVLIIPSGSSDLSLISVAADGTRAVLWLQGGQVGTTYSITVTIGTSAGRSISRSISLPVVSFVAAGSTTAPLTLEDGTTLIDSDGDALVLGSSSS